MVISEELKNIKYVLVSIELKNTNNMEQQGYLIGCQPIVGSDFEVVKANQNFLWLFRRGSVQMFHPDYYFISEITIGYAKMSSMRAFKDNEGQQADAMASIKEVMDILKENQMVRVNGLVDYQKYTDIPEATRSAIELPAASNKVTTIDNTHNRSGYTAPVDHRTRPLYGGYSTTVPYTPYVPKEVSTSSFKRTTQYDITAAVRLMDIKITEIKENKYVPPKLKSIPADDVADEEKVTTNVSSVYEYDSYGEYCG